LLFAFAALVMVGLVFIERRFRFLQSATPEGPPMPQPAMPEPITSGPGTE
jgi:hypothetical protein